MDVYVQSSGLLVDHRVSSSRQALLQELSLALAQGLNNTLDVFSFEPADAAALHLAGAFANLTPAVLAVPYLQWSDLGIAIRSLGASMQVVVGLHSGHTHPDAAS